MMIEKTFIPMIGLSYRPYRPQLVIFMKAKGYSTKPYFQIYLWLWVVTFRPLWRHESEFGLSFLWHKKSGWKA